MICHHSKDVSYGGLIEEKSYGASSNLSATVTSDFTGDNVPVFLMKLLVERPHPETRR